MLHLADFIKVIFLGIVEGLTEFIPVSSTAHLRVTSYLLAFESIENNLFETVIQIGAILAVCIFYRSRIIDVLCNLHQQKQQKFSINLALAFFPAVLFGLLFHDLIKTYLFSITNIAISLIIGGLIIIAVDHKPRKPQITDIDAISPLKALCVGLFQCVAMIPGTSRSGATIIGGLLLKFDRKTATEFSFLLAIPTIVGATVFDLYSNFDTINVADLTMILVGSIAAFLSAMLVIKWFLHYVSNHNFVLFGIYRIIIGALILLFVI